MFVTFLFIVIKLSEASGAFGTIIDGIGRRCHTEKHAELATAAITTVGVFAVASNTMAIVMVGPIAQKLYKRFKIDRLRGANVLSGFACGLAGLVPYNKTMMLMFTLAAASGKLASGFSIFSVPQYSFHCILLVGIYLICIITGLWRKPDAEYVAEAEAEANEGPHLKAI
jgi:Na+/H+ antiporter NhaC